VGYSNNISKQTKKLMDKWICLVIVNFQFPVPGNIYFPDKFPVFLSREIPVKIPGKFPVNIP